MFFEWLSGNVWRRAAAHESHYAYPLIECDSRMGHVHFFGLALLFDLRLLGWTMRRVPVSEMSRRLLPWTVVAFVVMVASGSLLLLGDTAADLSEYFLPGENADAGTGRCERLDFQFERLSARTNVGSVDEDRPGPLESPAGFRSCCGSPSSFPGE